MLVNPRARLASSINACTSLSSVVNAGRTWPSSVKSTLLSKYRTCCRKSSMAPRSDRSSAATSNSAASSATPPASLNRSARRRNTNARTCANQAAPSSRATGRASGDAGCAGSVGRAAADSAYSFGRASLRRRNRSATLRRPLNACFDNRPKQWYANVPKSIWPTPVRFFRRTASASARRRWCARRSSTNSRHSSHAASTPASNRSSSANRSTCAITSEQTAAASSRSRLRRASNGSSSARRRSAMASRAACAASRSTGCTRVAGRPGVRPRAFSTRPPGSRSLLSSLRLTLQARRRTR